MGNENQSEVYFLQLLGIDENKATQIEQDINRKIIEADFDAKEAIKKILNMVENKEDFLKGVILGRTIEEEFQKQPQEDEKQGYYG